MPAESPYRAIFFRLLGFLRPYRLSLWVSVALAVGSQLAQIALVAITGLGVVKAGLMVGRRLISGRQALGVEFDLRNALYAHLVRLSFGFYDRHQTGQLMSRATVDLQGVRFFLCYGLIFFFQNVLTVVFVTVVLFAYEWELAFVALAIT